jgi:hypothetical protein
MSIVVTKTQQHGAVVHTFCTILKLLYCWNTDIVPDDVAHSAHLPEFIVTLHRQVVIALISSAGLLYQTKSPW